MLVRFAGFAVRMDEPGRFRLARFLISCCAADAVPAFVEIDAQGEAIPPDNAWLEITGRLRKDDGNFVVAALSMVPREKPADPYLTSWE